MKMDLVAELRIQLAEVEHIAQELAEGFRRMNPGPVLTALAAYDDYQKRKANCPLSPSSTSPE
jgi:hypothetical protein